MTRARTIAIPAADVQPGDVFVSRLGKRRDVERVERTPTGNIAVRCADGYEPFFRPDTPVAIQRPDRSEAT